jgi:ATP-binding cassette, subfamily F, member 2
VKAEAEVNQMKAYKKEQEDIAKIKQFVASAGTYANLVKQAKSKLKIIEKMEERGLTEKVTSEHTFKFNFPECERLPPPILMFENVAFSYDGIVEHALYKNLSFGVDQDSRIALVGPNGAGKSTLLKLMVGEIMPTVGQVRRHMHLTFARYNQHSTDILDASKSALEFIPTMFPAKKMEETGWRQQIGKYDITGTMQTTPMGKLSDGMKARIIFGILSMQHPHILLLDEPTNHLDMVGLRFSSLSSLLKCLWDIILKFLLPIDLVLLMSQNYYKCKHTTHSHFISSTRCSLDSYASLYNPTALLHRHLVRYHQVIVIVLVIRLVK